MEDDDFDIPLEEGRRRRRRKHNLKNDEVIEMRNAMADELDDDGNVIKAGLSIQKVAKLFNVEYFTVYQVRRGLTYRKAGGPILEETSRRPPLSADKKRRLRRLRKKGATIQQLCDATGYGRTAIKKALSEPEE